MQTIRKKRCARRLEHEKRFNPQKSTTHEQIVINLDEFEAIRLCDYESYNQIEASAQMGVSRATIQRLLSSGRRKIVDGLLNNKTIMIKNETKNIILKGENKMERDLNNPYIIAMPTSDKVHIDEHFGHTKLFALYTVVGKEITEIKFITPPPHEPGVLPAFLAKQNANVIVTGGMGRMAINLFKNHNIDVILGASGTLEENAIDLMNGELEQGESTCTHGEEGHNHDHHHHQH